MSDKKCFDTTVEITGKIKLVIQKTKHVTFKTASTMSSVEKNSFVDEIQPVEFHFFLFKKVESARNSIQAREEPIYLAHA